LVCELSQTYYSSSQNCTFCAYSFAGAHGEERCKPFNGKHHSVIADAHQVKIYSGSSKVKLMKPNIYVRTFCLFSSTFARILRCSLEARMNPRCTKLSNGATERHVYVLRKQESHRASYLIKCKHEEAECINLFVFHDEHCSCHKEGMGRQSTVASTLPTKFMPVNIVNFPSASTSVLQSTLAVLADMACCCKHPLK
jgi:hypothetical protein